MVLRISVHGAFNIKTRRGPVITGKIEEGEVAVGDLVSILLGPDRCTVEVAAIEKFQEEGLSTASAGPDDVGIEILGVDYDRVRAYLPSVIESVA